MTNFYKIGVTSFQSQKKQKSILHVMCTFFMFFFVIGVQAQTTIINPATDGGFNLGTTFAANGWTVANQGVSPVKWAVGSAASGTTSIGATTNTNTLVTLTAINPNISVGQIVYGAGIPTNTFVSAISGTALTLSQPATLTGTGVTLGFGNYSGGISVGAVQTTNTSIAISTYTVTLSAANPNISVGMAIAPIAGFIGPNTYVASINGTALGLSQASINTAALATAQTLVFTATTSAISGNAAYISNDNGASNSYGGYPTNRTVYFYRDVTVAAAENAMTLTFDVKSNPASGGGWQVWVAPTNQTITGTDTQVTAPFTYNPSPTWAGATLISFNSNPQVATTKTTAFIPKSFAGTTFKLIFVWTNGTSAGTLPPATIDNISLTSRIPEEITCAQSGLWSQPSTWTGGKVPTHADTVVLDSANEVVLIDSRYSGCENLVLAGTNTLVQYVVSTVNDEFTINNDLNLSASGSRFNNHDITNGKFLKLGHNLDVAAGARFDSNVGSAAFTGRLTLNGSTVQTVTVDPAGFFGGSAPGTNAFANVSGVLNQLEVTNSSSASPNVIWNADGVRIKGSLTLTTGKVKIASGKRLILGNFSSLNTITCPIGYGFTDGTLSRWQSSASSVAISNGTEYPNTDVSFKSYWYPFVSANNSNRSLYLLPDTAPTVAAEMAITYVNSTVLTSGLTVTDGSYTINSRYGANWTFTTPDSNAIPAGASVTLTNPTGTYRLAVHVPGAYEALDGSSRLMNATTALAGAHQTGTATPFAIRTGLTLGNLTSGGAIYIGINDASKINTSTAITSAATGDWNTASTWVGGVVPSCNNNVVISTGHTVTVTSAANAAGVVVNIGGTLVNNGGTMTVGCTNNNAAFINYGTHTMTSGNLAINGFISQKLNSTFNQTGGNIIIDSNNNGDAATSVATGGASCKIETGNLALTGGKITIVDPLVNQNTPISVTSSTGTNLNTAGASGTFTWTNSTAVTATPTTSIVMTFPNYFFVGQTISGTGIAPGTTITAVTPGTVGFTPPTTLTLSAPTTAAIPASTSLTFSAMQNGASSIVVAVNANNTLITAGSGISGTGIQAGTTIVSSNSTTNPGSAMVKINLSLPVSGLTTSPITASQVVTLPAITIGSPTVILPAANAALLNGMPVSGTGILPGTFIAAVNGSVVTFSSPIQSGAPTPLVFNVYPDTSISSGSFVYNGPNYAAGLNHTLQIGDGVSTQKGAVVTNGFNCVFWTSNGMFSLGNLIVDAPDGENRFMSTSNFGTNTVLGTVNVQNQLTITSGSMLKKLNGNNTYYIGGNIVNNGSFLQPTASSPLYLGNFINGVAGSTTLAQTISGTGIWSNNQYSLTTNSPTGSVSSLVINNANPAGVTLQVPNFRAVLGVTLTEGILHTSSTYPIYCGVADVTGPFFGGAYSGGSATSYIDGPCFHANKSDSNITSFRLFPTGKNGKYLPISISSTGGVELMAEAFDTNSGSVNTTNASGISTDRWKVSRLGTAGTFTGYNVRLGSIPITSSKLIVHSSTENGTYDVVSTPASPTMTYTAPTSTQPSLIALGTAQTGGFLGNFSYANGAACTGTPTPGATIASTTTACAGQPVTLSLTTTTTGTNVTYQWQNSTNGGTTWNNILNATSATLVTLNPVITSYRCIVTCSSNTGTSTPVVITPEVSSAVVPNVTTNCSKIANLIASGSSQFYWYTAATGGNVVATGASYSPTLTATTNYYVATVTETTNTINTAAFAGTTAGTTLFAGITFDVTKPIKLKTVKVYPKNTTLMTPISISLYDETGNVVTGTSAVTFIPSLNTGNAGIVSQDITLNYNIPAGNGYRLVVSNGVLATTNNSLGNSTATISYPSGTTLVLKGNVTSLTAAPVTTNNTTTYFHNLTFDEICESVTRTSVTATLNTVTPIDVPTIITTAATCSAAGTSTVSNYSASLTYTFSPSGPSVSTGGLITGAIAGTAYTVTSGNINCTSAMSASFTNAAQLVTPAVPTLTTTAATCSAAGSATVSNYSASITYTFTPTGPTVTTGGIITGATLGTAYTVKAANVSCTSAASASFTNAAQLVTPAVPSVTTTAATCSAAGTTTVSNYNAALTYTFTPSGPTLTTGGIITGATAGTAYTVTAGNGSCTSAASASFTNAAQLVTPAVPTVTTTAATCSAAGTTTVSNYNAALTYTFTPSGPTVTTGGLITGATAGTAYTVTAGNGSCTSAASASFTNAAILAAPAAPTGSTNQTLTGGIASDVTIEDIVVTGSNGNWYATLANALANTNPLPVGTVLVSGTTYFTVSVSTNGCISSTALAVTVSITLSAESFEIENLTFYPNPVENQLNITASDMITKIEVYNLIGQQIKSISNHSNIIQIDLSELSSSTYIIKVYSEQKNQTIKVIKK